VCVIVGVVVAAFVGMAAGGGFVGLVGGVVLAVVFVGVLAGCEVFCVGAAV